MDSRANEQDRMLINITREDCGNREKGYNIRHTQRLHKVRIEVTNEKDRRETVRAISLGIFIFTNIMFAISISYCDKKSPIQTFELVFLVVSLWFRDRREQSL